MSFKADLYYSFRSPYSYLSIGRAKHIKDTYDLELNLRPVLPLAVREKGFFTRQNPLWIPYLLRDITRIAEMENIPLAWPQPDPVITDPVTRDAIAEQPYIHRLTHLAIAAEEKGQGIDFAYEVATLIWAGEHQPWNEGPHLANAAARAGLNLEELDMLIREDEAGYSEKTMQNQASLEAAGHWGVPTFVFEGEPFFGQDRITMFLWRMKQKGLKKRAG